MNYVYYNSTNQLAEAVITNGRVLADTAIGLNVFISGHGSPCTDADASNTRVP